MKINYDWLQTYFEEPLPPATEIERVLGERAFEPEGIEEVAPSIIIDFDVLPNRATDCLCHRGVAREVAALFQLELKADRYSWPEGGPLEHTIKPVVSVEEPERCPRYMARRIDNIKVGPSPDWLRKRLESLGQRSINNVVDATNYVMFDLGQPLHAFDADKVAGGITVRLAEEGEHITTLDQQDISLRPNDLVIADDEAVLAIAGVKGGTKAEVTDDTTSIIIEAASFNPTTTRRTSRQLGILTDSSKRFENAPATQLVAEAMEVVTKLILEVAGSNEAAIGPVTDKYVGDQEQVSVTCSHNDFGRLLGVDYSTDDIVNTLESIGCAMAITGEKVTMTAPWWRRDLNIKEDFIEEVGRIRGYDQIPSVVPEATEPQVHRRFLVEQYVRNWLAAREYSELYTYTFTGQGVVAMENAIASDKGFLRPSLSVEFARALERNAKNAPLFGAGPIKVFEIGTVFPKQAADGERWHLIIANDPLTKKARNRGARDELLVLLDELGQGLGVNDIRSLVVDKGDVWVEIDFSRLVDEVTAEISYQGCWSEQVDAFAETTYQPFSIYPFMTRDIALWVPAETGPEAVEAIINGAVNEWCQRTDLFDEFEKDGQVSYAFRLVFRAQDKTLSDDEVNAAMEQVNQVVADQGWEVR